jgi:hypothetical protein
MTSFHWEQLRAGKYKSSCVFGWVPGCFSFFLQWKLLSFVSKRKKEKSLVCTCVVQFHCFVTKSCQLNHNVDDQVQLVLGVVIQTVPPVSSTGSSYRPSVARTRDTCIGSINSGLFCDRFQSLFRLSTNTIYISTLNVAC